jgi:hypothetical protein
MTDRGLVQESFYLFALSVPALLERLMEPLPAAPTERPQEVVVQFRRSLPTEGSPRFTTSRPG